ncbi:MAG: hypothetical protein J6K17_09930 [Oscillospiraceae bacterium]|nr:hypothetical protein [Oscillospiraceae bacterium]
MEIFKQYDSFKEKCIGFPKSFEAKCFTENKFICHPTAKNELIAVCSDEEAHTNAICICRMADMLLMSEDSENWTKFNLAEARKIAEQNGFIYLTDLFAENAFLAEEWMIDGKHDTIIVNEEYMREKGMKYAPVTPLTNKVLHFKKYSNSFFWKSVAPGEILTIDKKYIETRFAEFYNECLEKLPDLSESETIDFALFNDKVTIDVNTTRARTIESFFENINNLMALFAENNEVLEMCEYDFSAKNFIIDIVVAALDKNDIKLSSSEFESKYYNPIVNGDASEKLFVLGNKCGDDAVDCVKLAFIDAITSEYKDEIKYSAEDTSFYDTKLRQMELGNYNTEEEQYFITELLSHKPGDYRVFYYAGRQYPDEASNLAAIADFWKIAPQNEEEMENTILSAYILEDNFDEQGRFCAGYEESRILKEKLEKVITKYGIDSRECIEELSQHIEIMDKERRTFNGTLFNTPEEKKLAVKNEAYIQDLCVDLSALNENELNSLNEHIENTTLDVNTKSKYQLKVKLAMNNVQSSMLEQRCLKLPLMTLDEIAELREKIISEDYPEAVVKPFEAKIRDAYSTAQTEEIEALLAGSENFSDVQLDDISTKLSSGRYDAGIAEHYIQKIDEIKDANIRGKVSALVEGYEDMNKEELHALIEKLNDDKYPKYLTGPLAAKIADTLSNYELNEAAKAFEGVDIATEEQLEEMKKVISEKQFTDEILAPYIAKVEQREKVLLDEELIDMCRDIDTMSQEELDELKEAITNSEKNFDEQLICKYLDKIAQKSCELTNSELAELCKYIFSMEQEELDELKEKLADDKYDKEFTDVYYRKIAEREQELLVIELDELCSDISEKSIPELEDLKNEILDNEAYNDICDKYIISINDRIEAIKIAEYKEKIDSVAEMTAEEVADFRAIAEEKREEIGEELYSASIEAADARDDALENEALEELCAGIDEYDFEKAESVKSELESGEYNAEKIIPYIEKIEERILELHTAELESYVDGISSMSKEDIIKAQIKVQDYDNGCPSELREKYNKIAESALADIADREVRELCGDISTLSVKKSSELIRKLDNMPLDPEAKTKYIDALDKHIADLKSDEAKVYIKYLSDKMSEFGINIVHLCVPGMSNLFDAKYSSACSNYVSTGRYELPILVHEGNTGEGFTMTTEYLYVGDRGDKIKIKINDIASFQAKKSLMSSILTSVERNGNTNEIPNALNKNVVENVAKVLTALVSFVHDQRSAEHMKEMLANAVQEKAMQPQTTAPVSAPVVETPAATEELKVNFCDQCGAKITNTNAKFCAECGNKLM